jgi:hypothetical protein
MTPDFQYAPQERIADHPDVLADLVRACCGWEPEDYAVSDESLLSDLVDPDADLAALYAAVRQRYGVAVTPDPEPYLWQLVEQIAAHRRAALQ